jgi:methionyl-tRNA formyltransferase
VKDPAFARDVKDAAVDILLNVHSLFVIHPDVVSAPKIGSYNLHPGPLPRYAGRNPVSWAIARGDTAYGVTLHRMEPGIDTGPVAFQTMFAVADHDTALSLYTRCVREGIELVRQLLAAASQGAGAIPDIPQDLSRREYVSALPPDGCRIRWSRAARDIHNLVRACDFFPFPSPWGHPRALRSGRPVYITRTHLTGRACDAPPGTIGDRSGGSVEIATGDDWLTIEKVILDDPPSAAAGALADVARLDDGV